MTSRRWTTLAATALLLTGCAAEAATSGTLTFSLASYPQVADHARDAMEDGESEVCTIDRKGASERRKAALSGIKTAAGKDRDEFPPAVCLEGGRGADVRLVPAKENRSAGAWMGSQLAKWPDGTKIRITVSN